MKLPRHLAVWEYLSEAVASLLLYLIALMRLTPHRIAKWLFESHSDIGGMIAGALALTGFAFAAFIAILVTDLGTKLRKFGQAKAYTIAFAVPPIANVSSLVALIFVRDANSIKAASFALLLIIYSVISTLTMLKNFIGVIGMWEARDRARSTGKR
jgi:membrane protein YdbS with pleckstrin-like domain